MRPNNRITVLAVGGAFALGAFGSNALGDDSPDWEDDLRAVHIAQGNDDQREDRRDDGKKERRLDGARDDDVVDVELKDEDEDSSGGGDTNSGGTGDGAKDNTGSGGSRPTGGDSVNAAGVAAAPAPAAPVYDDYSDDGGAYYGGGSDYGDS
jgi:hypothetical protein